jgi:hypothetical protein
VNNSFSRRSYVPFNAGNLTLGFIETLTLVKCNKSFISVINAGIISLFQTSWGVGGTFTPCLTTGEPQSYKRRQFIDTLWQFFFENATNVLLQTDSHITQQIFDNSQSAVKIFDTALA